MTQYNCVHMWSNKLLYHKLFLLNLLGERRLDPNTNMLALYEVNPFAEWIVKPRNCPNL